jgi:penicillin-binding protein 1C
MQLHQFKKWRYGVIVIIAIFLVFILVFLRVYPKPALRSQIAQSTAIYAADGTLLRLTLASDEQYLQWVPLKDIPQQMQQAVILYEDRFFHWHWGVNPVAMLRGTWHSLQGQRQGASTITMQLARGLYRINSRTISGKLKQIGAAIWLECRYSKAEIMEAYLNIAPYGGNIRGIGTASLFYFNKPVSRLNLPEVMTLAVIPQNPNKRLKLSQQNTALKMVRQRLWQAWLRSHPKDSHHSADMALPIQPIVVKAQLPFIAPHFTDAVLSAPHAQTVRTGLNLRAQASLERMVNTYIKNNQHFGIHNAVAMLLDANTMQVKALVGSADYFNADIDGQVNGASGKRSPGSTLKPFLYGLALDQSLIHPATMLKDTPTSFGPYTPENFDGRFIGPISAEQALIRSRNLPAVSLAAKLSKPSLYDFLKNAQVSQLKSAQHYGLALTLGGGELTMEELVSLYAMLANHGKFKPLSYSQNSAESYPLLSEEAAFITLEMLRQNPRPDTYAPDKHLVAWKTGTSWGFHDAWTIGVAGNDILAVWVGNFDGKPNPAFVGIKTAAPLFFQILDSLRHQRLLSPYSSIDGLAPRGVSRVSVCTASGQLPNVHCKNQHETWFIPGKSPIKVSQLHRLVHIDNSTGLASCQASANTHEEIIEVWDADMLKLFREAGMPRRTPPALPADCAQEAAEAPTITSPLRGVTYTIRLSSPTRLSGDDAQQTIALKANAGAEQALFWYANDALVGQAQAGVGLAWAPQKAGRYVLRAVAENGQADSREVLVEFVP